MSTVRNKIDNRLKNAHRELAKVTIYQKEQIEILTKVVKNHEKIYDKEMAELESLEVGSKEREEKQVGVDEVSNTIATYEEAISQYEMNLKELKAL